MSKVDLKGKNALVTGANGFVGRKLMETCKGTVPCPSLRDATEDQILRIVEESGADTIIHTAVISDIGACAANKLSPEERQKVLDTVHSKEFADAPPCQIVPALADRGEYIASESTMYRILHDEKEQNHRGRSEEPHKHKKPTSYCATAPNQVWTWDITYLNGPARGLFFYLYLVIDIFSRDIVGWEVWGGRIRQPCQ